MNTPKYIRVNGQVYKLAEKQYTIVDGPSTSSLVSALVSGNEVKFIVNEGTVLLRVNQLSAESGTRDISNWMFGGYQGNTKIKGYYDSKNKKGWVSRE